MGKRKEPPFTREQLEDCLREQKRIKLELQTKTCKSYRHINQVLCITCTRKNGPCSFKNLRAFKVNRKNNLVFGPYFPSATSKDPLQAKTHTTFKPALPQKKAKAHIIKYLKPMLSEFIAKESCLVNQPFPIQRAFTPGNNHYCDKCLTAIFNRHFICARCSYEICPKCYTNQDWSNCLFSVKHAKSSFLLFEKYTAETLEQLELFTKNDCIDVLQTSPNNTETRMTDNKEDSCLDGTGLKANTVYRHDVDRSLSTITNDSAIPKLPLNSVDTTLGVENKTLDNIDQGSIEGTASPSNISSTSAKSEQWKYDVNYAIISYEDLNLEKFQEEWGKSKPVVIKNSLTESKLNWSPEYFTKKYGKENMEIIDCADYKVYQTTVGEYFRAFSEPSKRKAYAKKLGSSEVLKVKDWPPTENIANKFPDLYEDFMATVPAPEYASAGGYFNLANRLPVELLPPDLGPKVFISYKTGKTNLHCDMADAVNIMYYASRSESEPVAAIWHIFPADAAAILSEWLKERHKKFLDWWHPIHSQSLFIDDNELKLLLEQTGIKPWVINQNPGDAVFIPAGCPHQVQNCQDAIKCAVDFLSPENLKWGASVTDEFSQLPKIDALQLKSTLLFTWKALDGSDK